MTESDRYLGQDDISAFVPFSEQNNFPFKVHTITLPIEFEKPPEIGEVLCSDCSQPYTRKKDDYTIRWGQKEQLVCVIHGVPLLACGCGTRIEDTILLRINEATGQVKEAISRGTREGIEALRGVVPSDDDLRRVTDFTLHRTVPYGKDNEGIRRFGPAIDRPRNG